MSTAALITGLNNLARRFNYMVKDCHEEVELLSSAAKRLAEQEARIKELEAGTAPQPAVLDEWQLVPKHPTTKWANELCKTYHYASIGQAIDTIHAVLAAAPQKGEAPVSQPSIEVPEGLVLVAKQPNKATLIGEFSFSVERTCDQCPEEGECEVCDGSGLYLEKVTVPWTTIKEIIAAHIAASPESQEGGK